MFISKIQRFFLPYICCICGAKSDLELDLCSICLNLAKNNNCIAKKEKISKISLTEKIFFDNLYFIFQYKYPANKFITNFKYSKKMFYGKLLAEILLDHIENKWYKEKTLPKVIIPVPMHFLKQRKRGFNQTIEILKFLKKKTKIKMMHNICVKKENTKPQVELNFKERLSNVKGTFYIKEDLDISLFDHIAIFDDVITTMSTVREISMLFKSRGVKKIDIWCICKN